MEFHGFAARDFDIFELPGFEARMPRLRAEITPKLKALGTLLAPSLREATGLALYPHVAMHLRRTVHAPVETWAAFGRSPRAYKPFVHLRATLHSQGVIFSCHLEDYADDKPAFAKALREKAEETAAHLARHPEIASYDMRDASGAALAGSALDARTLRGFADRLERIQGQHVRFGIPFGREDPALASADTLIAAAVETARALAPLYRLAL